MTKTLNQFIFFFLHQNQNIFFSNIGNQNTNESKEKAEILSNQFKSVFTKPKPNISTTVLPQRAGSTIQNLKITAEGVEKLLKNTNPSKAMGPDRIPNIILKTCPEELVPCLRNIFQKSVDCGTLPNDWLSANIAPVLKKGNVHAAENHRPISLTCVSCSVRYRTHNL
jgi:hypothetical protein